MKKQNWLKQLYIASIVVVVVGPWLFAIPHLAQVIPELIILIGFAGIIAAIQLNSGTKRIKGFQLMMIYMVAFIAVVVYTAIVATIVSAITTV